MISIGFRLLLRTLTLSLLSHNQFGLWRKTKFILAIVNKEFPKLIHKQLINPRKRFVLDMSSYVLRQTTSNTQLARLH